MLQQPAIASGRRWYLRPEIVVVRVDNRGADAVAGLQIFRFLDENRAVDVRSVPDAAPRGAILVHLVDQDLDRLSDLGRENRLAHLPLDSHEPLIAFGLDLLGDMPLEIAARGPLNILIFKTADARKPGLAKPIEEEREIFFRLARKADDEGRSEPEIGADRAPTLNAIQGFLLVRWAAHRLQHLRRGVLEGDVEVGEDFAFRHQRQEFVDVGIRVDIMQAHPRAELRQRVAKLRQPRLDRSAAPFAFRIFQVEAVCARVLADYEQFLGPASDERFRLRENIGRLPAGERAAQGRNDAKRAAVVAALGDLQI